jgi:hypothetical protein
MSTHWPHRTFGRLFSVSAFFVILRIVWMIRKTHPTEIYITWYIFSLAFVSLVLLGAYAARSDIGLQETFGKSGEPIFSLVYSYLTDFGAEIETLIAIVALVVLPQLLTYFLSGITGSANPPVFISQVTDLAT